MAVNDTVGQFSPHASPHLSNPRHVHVTNLLVTMYRHVQCVLICRDAFVHSTRCVGLRAIALPLPRLPIL